LFDLGLKAVL